MRQNGWTRLAAGLIATGGMLLTSAGCGDSDDKFENNPRPPVATQLTGVITEEGVTVSPDELPEKAKPGSQEATTDLDTPIKLIISNQTQTSHTITLSGKARDGRRIEVRTPPINPMDTGEIQQTLPPGTYEIRAGSARAVDPEDQVAAATLTVNPNRQTSSDDLLLP